MGLREVDQGRRAEQVVARLLNRWAEGRYTFRRRGLGQRGLPDLVATARPGEPSWPFVISVKGGQGATLGQLLVRAMERAEWRWWSEVCDWVPTDLAMLVGGWLIWRTERTWWLGMRASVGSRWACFVSGAYLELVPKAMAVFLLEDFLATVKVPGVLRVAQDTRLAALGKGGGEGAEQP